MPKGTDLNINIFGLHHDERWWQDPEAFEPERWIGDPTGGDKTGGLAYMPFGSGPRFCLGYKLARETQHMLVSVRTIADHFRPAAARSCLLVLWLRAWGFQLPCA